ncbi:TetR/AcrR family transcriptional regulator [Hyphococcus luteus]|uniref:HTH tetR-type domain-containing protein n=1 Tax=Hyphococcus luteus TaxID=2058213 RepID=A0A2S7KAK7_9PROT|nr:TetR/AcrR family transcriptional regulator [Marinicaulis flavus]PQA89554.1 hypothetical protein CW354_01400 [Marinicaulis flavus]
MMDKLSRSPQQERSRLTTKRFVEAALKLLEKQTYAELSLVDLAKTAKRSVGTFYQRFGSKDEFLKILLTDFLEASIEEGVEKWRGRTPKDILLLFLSDTYEHVRRNRNLWHAALERSAAQPDFWSNFTDLRMQRLTLAVEAMEESRGKKLSPAEYRRLTVAIQVFNSVVNNQVINSPGPLSLDDDKFLPTMTKIALDVAGFGK